MTDRHSKPSVVNKYGVRHKPLLLRVHGPRFNRFPGSHTKPLPWLEASGLPSWEQMSDVDKGVALNFLWKVHWERSFAYARSNYPARYVDDERLRGLDERDACRHAQAVAVSHSAALQRLGKSEWERLYNLALREPDRRCLWGVRSGYGKVIPVPAEQDGLDLLAAWAANDAIDPRPGWWAPGDPELRQLMRRDEPGGEWAEA